MTFDIYSDKSKRVIQRSAIRPARPEEGGFPNHGVVRDEATEEENTDETTKWTPKHPKSQRRTNKHKVKWHDTTEATEDQADGTTGFMDAMEGSEEEFSFDKPSNHDDLPQTHPMRRQRLMRKAKSNVKHKRTHLLAASTLLTLARNSSATIIDPGENILGRVREEPSWAAPFNLV